MKYEKFINQSKLYVVYVIAPLRRVKNLVIVRKSRDRQKMTLGEQTRRGLLDF